MASQPVWHSRYRCFVLSKIDLSLNWLDHQFLPLFEVLASELIFEQIA